MIYSYKGLNGCDSKCDIEVRGNIVIATELKENFGTSITNWAENLANDITKLYGIQKENLVWLECYDYCGNYAIVEFEIKDNTFVKPNWTHCSKETINKIVSGEIKIKKSVILPTANIKRLVFLCQNIHRMTILMKEKGRRSLCKTSQCLMQSC